MPVEEAVAVAAVIDGPPAVVVLGPRHLARDVVVHAVLESGVRLDLRDGTDPVAEVVVLVDPQLEDWKQASGRGAPIVLVSLDPVEDAALAELVRHGASAVVDLSDGVEHVVDVVERVAAHGTAFTQRQTRLLVDALRNSHAPDSHGPPKLSGREQEVLASIARGESTKQTARALSVSVKTVENIQSRLYLKLAVRTRAQAVAKAHSLNLTSTT